MSAEYEVQAEAESEDGGVSLAKGESDEVDTDTGSDITPTSHGSGASSTSYTNALGETVTSSSEGNTEHGNHTAEHQQNSASFNETLHESVIPPLSVPQAASSTTSAPNFDALHFNETDIGAINAGFDSGGQAQYFHPSSGDSYETLADQPNSAMNNLLLSNEMQSPDSFFPHLLSSPSDIYQTSTDSPAAATNNVTPPEHSQPPVSILGDETAQDTSENTPDDYPVLAGMQHIDESVEDWLVLSEDSDNIFSSDIAQGNGPFHTLNQASNIPYYYQDDEDEENSFFSVSFFLYHWKQLYSQQKPDYPRISQLAIERSKVQRPDKVATEDCEQCDYQGIHWTRFQTTKQAAREVRRMTYRNLRNRGPIEQNFGTKAFKANFDGAVLPDSDHYFDFNEMDMSRRPGYAHFQLRHNLSATSKNAIFYTYRSQRQDAVAWDVWRLPYRTIMCFNPETGTELCALDVNKRYTKEDQKISKIHTMTAGNGVLVAGSYEGIYAMKSLSADFRSPPVIGSIAVGADVSTNHIHTCLDRQNGLPRVVFDSNDRTVRVLDCSTSQWVACHKYPFQVNCSATSPDGRLRLLNGDCCEPIVANAETGETLAKLPNHDDFGFACDWAPDGITMATGHQDGLVKIWDARKLDRSLQTIAMEQAGCRTLQFSPLGSGQRVLVLAEPADFVHVVDARTFESKQSIDFFGEISGISMPPDGSKLYIANADSRYGGLMEFSRARDSNQFNRRPVGAPYLDDEHEEMVDLIVDGVQPARRFPRIEDKIEEDVELVSKRVSCNDSLKSRGSMVNGEEGQYRRDFQDPKRKGFKIGRKSESLDWLSVSDTEDDARVRVARGRRGGEWVASSRIDDMVM